MGRSIVKAALNHGDLVTAVGKTLEDTPESMARLRPSMLDSLAYASNYLGLICDVRVPETVAAAVSQHLAHWNCRLDIIANCSGYGVIGAVEDQEEFDIRNQFETNFFGTLHIIQASLAHFRSRTDGAGGRYLIFSSTSGALGVPGLGPYCATKYAVEGLIESMLYEIDAFNIKATLVEPGHVRRDEPIDALAGPLAAFGHFFIKPASEPYAGPTAPAAHAKRMVQWLGDKQPTSAVKSAELVWQLGHCQFPPLRLLLGSYAVESVRDRLKTIIEEIEDWKYLNFVPAGADGRREEVGREGRRKSSGGGEGEEKGEGEEDHGAEEEGDVEMHDDEEHGEVKVKDEDETMRDYSENEYEDEGEHHGYEEDEDGDGDGDAASHDKKDREDS